jgi:hypothetical protein
VQVRRSPEHQRGSVVIFTDTMRRIWSRTSGGPWFRWTVQGDVSSQERDSIIMFHIDARVPNRRQDQPNGNKVRWACDLRARQRDSEAGR